MEYFQVPFEHLLFQLRFQLIYSYTISGIADNPSPFQQMTFETAVGFLRSATLGGKSDTLDSPSSCIVMGKPFCGGTGTFQVRQSLLATNVTEQNF